MKESWEILSFENAIQRVKYTKKVPSINYLNEGVFPIVSQEEGLISGYWNNEEDVFKIQTPIVVFGDHTRIFKYIDFNFVLGADGVKILQPIERLNGKFFFFFLKSRKIESLGYSRHYKLLKDIEVPVPPLADQERIVSELDLLSGVVEKKKEQLKELDNLAQSIFFDMFGDPIANEKGWELLAISEIAKCIAGATPSTSVNENWINGTIPWLSSGEVATGRIKTTEKKITKIGYDSCSTRLIPAHSIVIAMAGQGKTRGTVGVAEIELCTNQSICSLINMDASMNTDFLYYQLKYLYKELRSVSNGDGGRGGLNLKVIGRFNVAIPPLALQQQFAEKITAIEQQKTLIKQSLAEAETLFNSRMSYYFD